jgi:hypothetical protein
MATEQNEVAAERLTLTRLAERGEEALKRLSGEIEKNQRVADARERLVRIEKSVLNRFNIAALDETEELRKQVADLEQRLVKLEGGTRKKAAGTPEA